MTAQIYLSPQFGRSIFVKVRLLCYLCREIIYTTMAKPIKETPVLTGEDAARFREAAENVVPATTKEKEEARTIYEAIMKNHPNIFR